MKADIVPLSSLETDAKNANRGTERGRYALERSLEKLGAGRSILLDKNGKIIAGNKTAETAGEMGIEDVVIVRTTGDKLVAVMREDLDLDDPTGNARLMAYADNRTGQLDLDFDPAVIAFDLEAGLDLSDWWKEDELTLLTADIGGGVGETADAEPQTDRAGELREQWQTATGQLWRLPSRDGKGYHLLACGDCTDAAVVEQVTRGGMVDIGHHDPPYGINLLDKPGRLGKSQVYQPVEGDSQPFDPRAVLNMAAVTLLWGANHFADKLPPSPFWLVWDKQGGAKDTTFATCELAWCSDKQPARVLTHVWDGWRRDSEKDEERYHPTQKPVAVIQWALSWLEGVTVLDCYCGSGSTILACENTGKYARAIEIDPGYTAVALDRYTRAFGLAPELVP